MALLLVPLLALADVQGEQSATVNGVSYTAALKASRLEGRPGEPVMISVILSPEKPPQGQFVSVLSDIAKAPAKPHVTANFPLVAVTCPGPGLYELVLRINFVEKSSCAGAKPHFIAELPVTIEIR